MTDATIGSTRSAKAFPRGLPAARRRADRSFARCRTNPITGSNAPSATALKKAKKEEKIKQQQERAALRKAGDGGEDAPEVDFAVNSGADPAAEDGERPSGAKAAGRVVAAGAALGGAAS